MISLRDFSHLSLGNSRKLRYICFLRYYFRIMKYMYTLTWSKSNTFFAPFVPKIFTVLLMKYTKYQPNFYFKKTITLLLNIPLLLFWCDILFLLKFWNCRVIVMRKNYTYKCLQKLPKMQQFLNSNVTPTDNAVGWLLQT